MFFFTRVGGGCAHVHTAVGGVHIEPECDTRRNTHEEEEGKNSRRGGASLEAKTLRGAIVVCS